MFCIACPFVVFVAFVLCCFFCCVWLCVSSLCSSIDERRCMPFMFLSRPRALLLKNISVFLVVFFFVFRVVVLCFVCFFMLLLMLCVDGRVRVCVMCDMLSCYVFRGSLVCLFLQLAFVFRSLFVLLLFFVLLVVSVFSLSLVFVYALSCVRMFRVLPFVFVVDSS